MSTWHYELHATQIAKEEMQSEGARKLSTFENKMKEMGALVPE